MSRATVGLCDVCNRSVRIHTDGSAARHPPKGARGERKRYTCAGSGKYVSSHRCATCRYPVPIYMSHCGECACESEAS